MCVCVRASPFFSPLQGTVHFPGGSFVASWAEGKVVEGEYVFTDGLKYSHPPSEWTYCTGADRRFHSEVAAGILAAGETQLTNQRGGPPIPAGCFDAGDGYYDPKKGEILSYDTHAVVRKARADEVAWISRKCAFGDGGSAAASLRDSLASR